ncbi:bestrophin family protein [Vulgatibacter sp.]|uniref:bestrophin family protein n=1 Tax=Vulgatibacter sp. TaxID=1971226 RepID=UPI003563236C
MIVRNRPSAIRLFLVRRGTILPRIKWQVLLVMALGAITAFVHGTGEHEVTASPVPFSLVGIALAIFLGFRNSASHDRWWEGRKLWGELVIRCRSAARLLHHHGRRGGPEMQQAAIRRLIGFAHALRHHLRGTPDEETRRFLRHGEAAAFATTANRPDFVLRQISREVAEAAAAGAIDPMIAAQIEENLTALAGVQAGCERIRLTPLPFSYSILLHRTAWLFCIALPFGIVSAAGWLTPFAAGLVAYAFFGLDALGDELEEPFGLLPNDLPLAAICRRVEIDLLEVLGERELPPTLEPVDYVLG